jgi:hypothetical protein
LVALGWGVALAQGLARLTPGPALAQGLARLTPGPALLMTLTLGSITTIVISSPEIAKEALQKKDQAFSSQTIPDTSRAFDHDKVSMVWLPALAPWRNPRKPSATQIFAPQQLDATQALRRKKVQELLDHVNQCCNSGEAVDIGRAIFVTVLNAISNTFFSFVLAQYSSNLSLEFQDLICGVMEGLGKPNVADYFPAHPQGARRRMMIYFEKLMGILDGIINERVQLRASSEGSKARMIYFEKLMGILDGIINERVQLRASSEGSKASNDVLDSFLNLAEEDNSEISHEKFKHLLLVIEYLS